MTVRYLQVEANSPLPQFHCPTPCKVIILCEMDVTPDWQWEVSEFFIRSGCLYMMAWGIGCSSWDDSFDMANILQYDFKDVPEEKSVMTTWHEHDTIDDVFYFCKFDAEHPSVDIDDVVIFHVSKQNAAEDLLQRYEQVCF